MSPGLLAACMFPCEDEGPGTFQSPERLQQCSWMSRVPTVVQEKDVQTTAVCLSSEPGHLHHRGVATGGSLEA